MTAPARPLAHWASLILLGALILLAAGAALAPWLLAGDGAEARVVAAAGIFTASYLALAIGRIPGLAIDRAGIALVGASLMVASGAISLPAAYKAIDIDTITLLLGMMIVVANLRLSGAFALVAAWIARRAAGPVALLAAVALVSGVASAFLVNDAICLVLAPLVVELALEAGLRPLPYLLATAMASNIGSVATITGNPQNMLIGGFSGLPYATFAGALAPVAGLGWLAMLGLVLALHRGDFRRPERPRVAPPPPRGVNRVLVGRAVAATAAVIVLFFAGQPPAKAAIVVGAALLLTRRVKSWRVYAEVDWSLLLMFAGLFVIVAGAEQRLLSPAVLAAVGRLHLERVPVLAGITLVLSNLVSNVPAVLVLRPFVAALADPRRAWLVVAMASTLAGNLTLLGSIANLIVAEKAARRGVAVTFGAYLRVGVPVTLVTLGIGIWWLG